MQSRAKPRHSCFSSEDDREDSSDEEEEEWQLKIGWPTSVEHKEHVTFDPFEGYLGLPQDFAKQVPAHPPSASKNVFGVSPSSMQCSFDDHGNSVPTILLLLQTRLYNQGGLKAEGIFRVAARIDHEEHVQKQLNEGTVPKNMDVYALAGLIKRWLRDLPDGVLDAISDTDVEKVAKSGNEEAALKLVEKLPGVQRSLLDWAVNLMADVVEYEEQNLMNIHNIATVFAPNLIQLQIEDAKAVLFHASHVMKLLKLLVHQKEHQRQVTASAFSGSFSPGHGNSIIVGVEGKERGDRNFSSQNGLDHGSEDVTGSNRFLPLNGSPLSRDQPLPETLPAGFVREGEEEEALEVFSAEEEEKRKTTMEGMNDVEDVYLGEQSGRLRVVHEAADLELEDVLEEAREKQLLNPGPEVEVLEDKEVVDATPDVVEGCQTDEDADEFKRIFSIAHSITSNEAVSDPDTVEPMERIFSIAVSTTSSVGTEATYASEVVDATKFPSLEVAPASRDEALEGMVPAGLDEDSNVGAIGASAGIVEMEGSSVCPIGLEDTVGSSSEGQILGHDGVDGGLDFIGVEGAVAPENADVKLKNGVIQMKESSGLIKLEDFLSFSQIDNTSGSLKLEEVARPSGIEDPNRAYSLDVFGDPVETEIGGEGWPIETKKAVCMAETEEDAGPLRGEEAGPLRGEEAAGLSQVADEDLGSGLGESSGSHSAPVEGRGTGTEVEELDGPRDFSSVDNRGAGHIGQEEVMASVEKERVDGRDDIVCLNMAENAESNVVKEAKKSEDEDGLARFDDRLSSSEGWVIEDKDVKESVENMEPTSLSLLSSAETEVTDVDGPSVLVYDDLYPSSPLESDDETIEQEVESPRRRVQLSGITEETVPEHSDGEVGESETIVRVETDGKRVHDLESGEDGEVGTVASDGCESHPVHGENSRQGVAFDHRDEEERTTMSQSSSIEAVASKENVVLTTGLVQEINIGDKEFSPGGDVITTLVSNGEVSGELEDKVTPLKEFMPGVEEGGASEVVEEGSGTHTGRGDSVRSGEVFGELEDKVTPLEEFSPVEEGGASDVVEEGSGSYIGGGDSVRNGEVSGELKDKVIPLEEFSPGVEEGGTSEVVEEGSGTHIGGGEEGDRHLRESAPKVDEKAFITSPSHNTDEFLLLEGVSGFQPTAALPRFLHL